MDGATSTRPIHPEMCNWDYEQAVERGTYIVYCPRCDSEIVIACEWQGEDYDVGIWPGYVCGGHVDYPRSCACNYSDAQLDELYEDISVQLTEATWERD
jgi:hypothetical protein